MKGPTVRILNQVARRWRCPRCGKDAMTPGNIVHYLCPACPPDTAGNPTAMALQETKRRKRATDFPVDADHAGT